MKTVQEIADYVGGTLRGDPDCRILTVASLERAGAGALAYAETRYLQRVPTSGASCVLVPSGEFPARTVVVVKDPRISFARVAQWLLPSDRPLPGVHPTAVLHENTVLAQDVAIGAWVVIESGTRLGNGTVVLPGCYIGKNCHIGANCVIYPHAVLYPDVTLGDRVIVHAGVILGADGFGFVFDGTQQLKIPQIGHVTVGSDVEIGANSCVDRGALDNTSIYDGAKIDNLCQVAHNVQIGSHAIISSQTGIAGSSRVGSQATIGGQVGIADHCRIDDYSVVGAQCGVPSGKHVPAGETYWGTPARPLKDVKVQLAHVGRLPKMAQELKRLRAEVEQLKNRLEQI